MTRTEAIIRRLIEIKGRATEEDVYLLHDFLDCGGVWINVPGLQPLGFSSDASFYEAWEMCGFMFEPKKKTRRKA
jgi:hypothetical protein